MLINPIRRFERHVLRMNTKKKKATDVNDARLSKITMSQEIDIKMLVKHTEREKERSRLHKKVTKHTSTCLRSIFKSIKE